MSKKLFIVSNRLPLTVEQTGDNYEVRQSSGGLISAISAYLKQDGKDKFSDTVWVGAPGCSERNWDAATASFLNADYNYSPVFINWKKYELYYNGFSNSLIWPLFHYFPSFADYTSLYFTAYKEVNEQFARQIAEQVTSEDVVWIHDYHLMPLSGMLRKLFPDLTIGFFLHIPFPSYELFRVIPRDWQKEILTGLLGADLIGFHTADYAAHFLSSIEHILKIEHDGQNIQWENRTVKVDAFPISIDYRQFSEAYDDENVVSKRVQNLQLKAGRKLIFSVDRLDYTKGISNRLRGYEQFLTEHPEYTGNVVFVLVIVPSRDGIIKYAERKRMIDEYIGNLNSRLGNILWQPVVYQYAHLNFEELVGLYTACDIALITPIRDGMNLVAKEFVASRQDKHGVLILSEMAGAAVELQDALLINPNDIEEISGMIKIGLEMDSVEQSDRLSRMQKRIEQYNVITWSADYFAKLSEVKDEQLEFAVKFLDHATRLNLTEKYSSSLKRLLLFDYDGTLTPFSKKPSDAKPSDEILYVLKELSQNPLNDVFIVSGRDSETLENWFGVLEVGLIAEHGVKVRMKGNEWVNFSCDTSDQTGEIEQIMLDYCQRTPGAFVEKKEYSTAWHYRNVDLVLGTIRAKELHDDLARHIKNLPLNLLNGHKVIEVKPNYINKGVAIEKLTRATKYDFILCLGDDETDEDMFKKLARLEHAYTIKVGAEASYAKYNLYSPGTVSILLEDIALYSGCLGNSN